MSEIIRMYEILPSDTKTIRGWQGHKKEKKWFYCNTGSFIVNLMELDDFEAPSKNLEPNRFILEAKQPSVLEVSGGYATAFKAQEEDSKLIVFSNFSLDASKNDDFRFPLDFWNGEW
ncbi:sugar epimerase [Maribacter sp. 2308TA10-17]|uniref:sugar epimerase n=1 Tax=Maribacter sp. 2308TA10-17 TaxID=3386276 RepID=UPI0039BD6FD6